MFIVWSLLIYVGLCVVVSLVEEPPGGSQSRRR